MANLTRREFLLICGAGVAGMLGTATAIKPKTIERTEYVANFQVNTDEFLLIPKGDIFYVALGGVGLVQGQEEEFTNELISKNIIEYDACFIHNLPKAQETDSTSFKDLTISAEEDMNYTLSSENEELIKNAKKYSSDVLAHNYELFGQINKTK